MSNELKKVKDDSAPLEETVRKLRADKEAMEAANAQLLTDTNYWKVRKHPNPINTLALSTP